MLIETLGLRSAIFCTSNPQFKFKQPTQGHRALLQAIKGKQAVLADKLIQAGAKIEEADKFTARQQCVYILLPPIMMHQ